MANGYSDLYDTAVVYFRLVPKDVINLAIIKTLRKFFSETKLLDDKYYFNIIQGQNDYILDIPDDKILTDIVKVYYSNENSNCNVDDTWGTYNNNVGFDGNYRIDLNGLKPIIIFNNLNPNGCGNTICVEYNYIPSNDSCSIPAYLINKYEDVLLDGVRAFLYNMPDLDIYNEREYALALTRFGIGIKKAIVDKINNYSSDEIPLISGYRWR